jgi:hypothetical protein
MDLLEMQRRFFELATRAPGARPAEEVFVGTPGLAADARLRIYADMFLWRQIDSLREDFPKLAALLGDHGFYATAERYLAAHPSTNPSLSVLGRHLASFLAESAGPRSDLADMAALEWTRNEVFDEAPAGPAGAELIEGRADAASLRLRPVPALRLLSLRHEVVALWTELDEGRPPPAEVPGAQHVAVWRKDLVVYHCALAADEARALRRALDGGTLAEICDAFSEREDAVASALAAVASWFKEGWIEGER